jgi:hypothetical protein
MIRRPRKKADRARCKGSARIATSIDLDAVIFDGDRNTACASSFRAVLPC